MKFTRLIIVFLIVLFPVYASGANYCAKYAPVNTPSQVKPGETFSVQMNLTNCGYTTWVTGQYFLSYHWFEGSKQVVWDGIQSPIPAYVLYNKSVTVQAQVKAPDAAGTYTLKWDMLYKPLWGNPKWFSQAGAQTFDQTVQAVKPFAPVVMEVIKIDTDKLWQMIQPQIKSVGPAMPGADIYIAGVNFGQKSGTILFKLPSGKTITLIPLEWKHNVIKAKVPPDITGEKDGNATVEIMTAFDPPMSIHEWTSNKMTTKFTALREIKVLPKQHVTANCADPWNCEDRCQYSGSSAFSCLHDCFWAFSGKSGNDSFKSKISLKNGWVVKKYSFWYGGHQAWINKFHGAGSPSFEVNVAWKTSFSVSHVKFAGVVYIEGPKGIPYL
jgi:hypothetical protein